MKTGVAQALVPGTRACSTDTLVGAALPTASSAERLPARTISAFWH